MYDAIASEAVALSPACTRCVHITTLAGTFTHQQRTSRCYLGLSQETRAILDLVLQVVSNEADRWRSRGGFGIVLDNFNDQVGGLRISKSGDADLSDEVAADFATV